MTLVGAAPYSSYYVIYEILLESSTVSLSGTVDCGPKFRIDRISGLTRCFSEAMIVRVGQSMKI